MKYFLLILFLLVSIATPAYAQGNAFLDGLNRAGSVAQENGLFLGDAESAITAIIRLALSLIGIIATSAIIYGGFLYVTAAGDDKKVGTAKNIILYAVIGLLIIGAAAIVTNVVITTFSS